MVEEGILVRVILPDSTILVDYMLARFTGVMKNLLVYPKNMTANMEKMKGLIHSQRVLLALTERGVSREDAYRLVQRNAMEVWKKGLDFKTLIKKDAEIRKALTAAQIDECFSLAYHTKNVDYIFRRAFGKRRVSEKG